MGDGTGRIGERLRERLGLRFLGDQATAAQTAGRLFTCAWVARAAAQAMSQWLAGVQGLGPSEKIHFLPWNDLRRAKKSAAMSWWETGKRFSMAASWFMRAKPRSCFLERKLTGMKRGPKRWAASQQIWRPRPVSSPAARRERRPERKLKRTVLRKCQSSVRQVKRARSQSSEPR